MTRRERRVSSEAARASPAVEAELTAAPRHSYAERDACIHAHPRAAQANVDAVQQYVVMTSVEGAREKKHN